jgi:Flp pilus assembly CpaE family ATPase
VTYRIPNDYRAAVQALNQGQPLAYTEGHKVGPSLKAMARELGGVATAVAEPAAPGGLLGRLAFRRT